MKDSQVKTSYSALDTFRQCPLKYKFRHIDKIKTPKSKEAIFGSKLHKALQYFHSQQPAPPTLDELLNYLKDIWESESFNDEQEDLVYFSEAVNILKNYYNQYYLKNKGKFTVIDTEVNFTVTLKNPSQTKSIPSQCVLRGIIDRIDKTKHGIEIIDYKTAKRLPSQQTADNSLQLSLYCLGLINRWPKLTERGLENIKLTFYYLKHQEAISTTRNKQQLKEVEQEIWERLAEIKNKEFKPRPSVLCDWCGYKNICPMWKHKFEKEETTDDKKIEEITKEFFELKEQNKKNRNRIGELKELINQYLDKKNIERIFSDFGYITRSSQARFKYEDRKIKKILEPIGRWEEVLTVDDKKLKNILKTLPRSIRRQIEKAKKKNKEYKTLKIKKEG